MGTSEKVASSLKKKKTSLLSAQEGLGGVGGDSVNGGIRIAYVAGQSLPASMGASQLLLSGVSKNRVL